MKGFFLVGVLILVASACFSQTCTISGSGTILWVNGSSPTCSEGGTPTGKSKIVIPAGVVVEFDTNTDTWTGDSIVVKGELKISKDVDIFSSIKVFNGGKLTLAAKLYLGGKTPAPGCNYNLGIFTGGLVDVGGTASDRMVICGVEIMKGAAGGSCNACYTCPYNPPGQPYCEPAGGFMGPLGYSKTGYDSSVTPITLLYFLAKLVQDDVQLEWATTMEQDFEKFVIERSQTGVAFEPIGEVPGSGSDLLDVQSLYSFTDTDPLLGFNYYRLKAVDLDGSYEYFGVRVVKLSGEKQLSVYPNPSPGNRITYDVNFNPSDNDEIVVISSLGVELYHEAVSRFKNEIILDNPLGTGVYILKYRSSDFETAARVMVR